MLNLKFPNPFLFPFALVRDRISIKTHSVESRFGTHSVESRFGTHSVESRFGTHSVESRFGTGLKNLLFAGVCVHF